MKCSYCKKEYPSLRYFIYNDPGDHCIYCFKSKKIPCKSLIKGLSNLSTVNSSSIWLKKLENENIINDKYLLRFIISSLRFLVPVQDSPDVEEKIKVSITQWGMGFDFKTESLLFPGLIMILILLSVTNLHIYITIMTFVCFVLLVVFFHSFFKTGKKCSFNLNEGYLMIKIQNHLTAYLNRLPLKLVDYQDKKLYFDEIKEVQLIQQFNRIRGEHTWIILELQSGQSLTLGYLFNHEYAFEFKSFIEKIIYKKLNIKYGFYKCV